MPPLPAADKVVQIAYTFTLGEDFGARVRHFYQYEGSAPDDTELNTFCASISTSFNTNLKPLMSVDYTLTSIDAIDLTSDTGAVGRSDTDRVGTRSGDILTAADCTVISRHVARRYRGGHPRMYWPFGVQGDLEDAQTWADAYITSATSGYDAHATAIEAAGWGGAGDIAAVNVSYYKGFTVVIGSTGRARNVSTPRDEAVIDPVTGFTVRKGVGTQRNRLLHLA